MNDTAVISGAFGASVRRLRGERGWSTLRLALESGVPNSTVGRAESGGGVTLASAVLIARGLGASLDEMVAARAGVIR